jgi:single-stranded-DNA-specific exonuclease
MGDTPEGVDGHLSRELFGKNHGRCRQCRALNDQRLIRLTTMAERTSLDPSPPPPRIGGVRSRWVWRMGSPLDPGPKVKNGPLIERVLAARGLSPGEIPRFLEPSLKDLHEPSLMPDLERAASRLLVALHAGEKITIYGDYDVDGVTSTAILFHTLKTLRPDANLATYVPHRLDEGYGLNESAIAAIAAEGTRVIVSVDCGITAMGPARLAREAGVDLIITDHHNPPADCRSLPEAYAVVHPRVPGSAYPFGDLSGAGVAYKLAWRLATMHAGARRVSPELRALLIELLAFAALGAVADGVPLVGENRVLARHGLGRVKHSPIEGLRALVEASGLAGENIDAEDAGFLLAPRLNACGRLGHAREAVELFTTAKGDRARAIATELSALNERRKAMEQRMTDEACAQAEDSGMIGEDRRAIVLASPEWHAGVIGIVCSRLVDRFGRPTLLMQTREGECHGSGRSIEGFSLHAALTACHEYLVNYGGHDMAAGLRVQEARLPGFAEAFTEVANARLAPADLGKATLIDADVTIEELTLEAARALERLEPFGRGNPRPKLLLRGVRLAAPPQRMGATGQHLSLRLERSGAPGAGGLSATLRVVGWRWGEHAEALSRGVRLDAVISPKISAWNGRVSVEGELEDFAVSDEHESPSSVNPQTNTGDHEDRR